MKILFINKYDTAGGAGITAVRLGSALEKYFKTENYFLVGIKKSSAGNVFETRKKGLQNFIERGTNLAFNLAGLQYKWFPFSTGNILRIAKELSPDIISLHNLHGGYFKTSLLAELSKIAPLYWTLHDMWAITANAAHTYGDESWKKMEPGKGERMHFPQIGLNTGKWLLKEKQRIYSSAGVNIITPSKWLYNLAIQSPVFSGLNIYQIYNGIDTEVFKNPGKKEIRKKLNIPEDAKVILFGAEKIINNAYKGGQDLLDILGSINRSTKEKIHLIIIGEGNLDLIKKFDNFILHATGYINNESTIAEYLSASDVLIYPTKADTLPNALIEASACGVPAVTFDVGGCSEIIKDDVNGKVVPPSDTALFAEKTLALLNDKKTLNQFSLNAREIVLNKFDLAGMSRQYFDLYTAGKKI